MLTECKSCHAQGVEVDMAPTQDERAQAAHAADEGNSYVTIHEESSDRSDMEWVLELKKQMNMIQVELNQLQTTLD
eukprot:11080909-Prorocentrum_lima.AAC.1